MSEILDKSTLIPAENFRQVFSASVPAVTDSKMVTVGDPYVKITASDGKEYYTRSFNQSELLPKEVKKYMTLPGYYGTSGTSFIMPIIEKFQEADGKLVGYLNGRIDVDDETGKNKLMVSNIEISNTPKEGKLKYGATFASSQKDAGMKTDIGRNILTSVLTKLPFIETIGGYRISGARQKTGKAAYTKVEADKVNRVKEVLAKQGHCGGGVGRRRLGSGCFCGRDSRGAAGDRPDRGLRCRLCLLADLRLRLVGGPNHASLK